MTNNLKRSLTLKTHDCQVRGCGEIIAPSVSTGFAAGSSPGMTIVSYPAASYCNKHLSQS